MAADTLKTVQALVSALQKHQWPSGNGFDREALDAGRALIAQMQRDAVPAEWVGYSRDPYDFWKPIRDLG